MVWSLVPALERSAELGQALGGLDFRTIRFSGSSEPVQPAKHFGGQASGAPIPSAPAFSVLCEGQR
jgi:hypothetical protein